MKKNLWGAIIMLSKYFVIGFFVQLIVFSTLLGKSVEAQLNNPVHANLQNVSVKHVFDILKRSANITFVYDSKDVNGNQQVNIAGDQLNAAEVLNKLAVRLDLSYKKIGNTITLKKKSVSNKPVALPHLPSPFISLRNKNITTVARPTYAFTVSGTVTDSTGNPLIGVSVQIKGTSRGTVTDANGHYEIEAPEDATLVFSYVGYQNKEVPVNSREAINVTLSASATGLNEVVVVGYGTQKKVDLTGAVTTVSGDNLNKRVATNPVSLLQGKVPGMLVTQNSAEPGNEDISLRIRGQGTFSDAGNDPLVIVDGIPGSLSALNPSDIASITVLKDAASASIYGSRAANGVILVTTKTGNRGAFQLEYNFNLGITSPARMLDIITNSADYMQMFNDALIHSGDAPYYPDSVISLYRNATDRKLYPNVNWLDIVFNTVLVRNHYLSLSGGGGKSEYKVSLGYINEPGTMMGFEYKKYTVQFNLNSNLNEHIKFGTNINLNHGKRMYPRQGASDQFLATLSQGPMYGPYLPDGSGRYTYRSLPYAYHNKNPVAIANTTQAINNAYYVQGSLFLDVSLLDNLIWETRGGLTYSSSKTKDFRPTVPQYWWFTGEYATDLDVGSKGLDVADETYIHPILYSQLTYSKNFGDHNFKILAGWQDEYFKDETLGGFRQGFPNNFLRELNAGSPDGQTTRGSAYEWALLSFYGRLNYNYKNKYLLEANIRKDGSSRFAKGNRWGTFPSISAGWRISEEPFLKNASGLSNLKLRASWGRLGNQNIGNYPYQKVLDLGYPYPFDYSSVTQGAIPSGLVDPDIRWETTEAFDIGADLSLFSNKLNFSIDWFRKMTYDILREAQVPAYFGLSAPTINGGKMKNTGWEFVINYKNNIGKLNYNIGGNFQTFKNTVVKFGAKSIGGTTITEEGKPWETFYLYDWISIFQSQDEIDKSPKQPYDPKPGDLKFRDVNGDGVIDADDRTYFGGAFPDFTYSFHLGASFKHFDLSALFYGVQGRKYYVNAWGLEPFFQSNPPTVDWKNAWTENNHTNAMPHIYVQGYPPIDNMSSTYFLKNASYLRLRNVQLGYNIPQSVLDSIFIKSLRLYFSGENLFIITDYPWLDPERGGNGRFVNYPQNKVFNFGIDVTF